MPRPVQFSSLKHDREIRRAARRAEKAERRAARKMERCVGHEVETDPTAGMMTDDPHDLAAAERDCPEGQFPTAWPDAPEPVAGVARTLSRGL